MKKILLGLVACFAFGFSSAQATVIDFEDLNTRNSFDGLGIDSTYQGYEWGYGNGAGISNRTFSDASSYPYNTGWGSATAGSPVLGPAPSNLDGSSYGWNWNGPQSLWIDFKTLVDFSSGDFAKGLGYNSSYNADTLQLFGYDASDALVATSSTLILTEPFQTLSANFTDIQYLEIRANANYQWFAVDNLRFGQIASVPEPTSFALMGLGILGLAFTRRQKRQNAEPSA